MLQINWMRAARTDKGVSAVGQLVSLKMVIGHSNYDVVENINKHLPDQIRVLGYTKTTAGFDARKHCDKRRYEYVLPVWAFDPKACRGRLCVEEAELRSGANPTAADGVLPSAASRNTPTSIDQVGQAHHANTSDAIAEATATAVAATAAADGHTAPLESSHATSASAAEADLPQLSPTEALQAVATEAAQPSPSQGAANCPAPAVASIQIPQASTAGPAQAANSDGPAPLGTLSLNPAPDAAQPSANGIAADQAAQNSPAEGASGSPAPDAEQPSTSGFVFDNAAASKLTTILRQYEGTHNFHNYTVRLEATDPSAKRYMLSCTCAGVFDIQVTTHLPDSH